MPATGPLVIADLFSGLGGFSLAARWRGWRTAWHAEIDPYTSARYAEHFPGVPNYGDIRGIDGRTTPAAHVLAGGFPCQDVSQIGKGAGLDGARSGLWSEFKRLIGEARPPLALIENVAALRSRGLDRVLADLYALGYDAEWHCIPAAYVGAPHRRDRVWVLAYPIGSRLEGYARYGEGARERPEPVGPASAPGVRGDVHTARWWATSSGIPRVAHGVPHRVERLTAVGNAIVPHVAAEIFRWIDVARGAQRAA